MGHNVIDLFCFCYRKPKTTSEVQNQVSHVFGMRLID